MELAQRVRSFRDQLHVILLSGRESAGQGYPLIRKPILRSELQLWWQKRPALLKSASALQRKNDSTTDALRIKLNLCLGAEIT